MLRADLLAPRPNGPVCEVHILGHQSQPRRRCDEIVLHPCKHRLVLAQARVKLVEQQHVVDWVGGVLSQRRHDTLESVALTSQRHLQAEHVFSLWQTPMRLMQERQSHDYQCMSARTHAITSHPSTGARERTSKHAHTADNTHTHTHTHAHTHTHKHKHKHKHTHTHTHTRTHTRTHAHARAHTLVTHIHTHTHTHTHTHKSTYAEDHTVKREHESARASNNTS
jgi:hypothetical protein